MSTVLGGGVSMLLRSSGLVVGSRTRFCVSRPAWGIGGSASASPKSKLSEEKQLARFGGVFPCVL